MRIVLKPKVFARISLLLNQRQ